MRKYQSVLLSSAYLGPIQYYSKIISTQKVLTERWENYQKQSYRNRCVILAANGPLVLSIPVSGGPGAKDPMHNQEISYDQNWQQLHWRSIVSAYKNSPFFDYYSDDLYPFYHLRKWKSLINFNFDIQNVVLNAIGFKSQISFTDSYVKPEDIPDEVKDYRYTIHPKPARTVSDEDFFPARYTQVFNEKFDFQPNLSILDLFFNEGPQTLSHLQSCER